MSDAGELTGTVADRYTIEHEVGRGGMATVYRARDLRHGSIVALKVLLPELSTRLSAARFEREIRITAGLQHPNILPVLDSGEVLGLPFYVMPFVEGETLQQRLDRERSLAIPEALRIASEVAEALAHAHARGFVHRDIKPSNILMSHGHALLSDFGIARILTNTASERLTETGHALGTAWYMSPEQAAGEPTDARSDIYSLGCVLYEMLAGTPPFVGMSAQSVMARHAVDPVPSIRTVRPTAPPALEKAIEMALAKVAADRFATADEFKAALQDSVTSEKTVPPPAPPVRHRIRRPGAAMALAATGALAALAAMLYWRTVREDASALDPNRIMVFPLVAAAAPGIPATIGEDVAIMIGSALDGAGPLRWIDGWALLDATQRASARSLTLEESRALARSKRCAWFLTGRVVTRGDSAAVILDLRDVAGDSVVAGATASAPPPDAWRAGLRAVNALLPKLIPAGSPNVDAEWSARDPAAVARFLLGEAAFRRAHPRDALGFYRDAVRLDSSFGLAAIRGAQAATWDHQPGEAASLIRVATRQPLSPRYDHFAQGYQAYLQGNADSAAARFRRALEIDPEMVAGWMQLGEVYTHLLPKAGRVDSLAQDAFERAHRIDPSASNILLHLIEIRLRNNELDAAAPLVSAFLAANPDTVLAAQVEIMDACVRRGSAAMNWDELARTQAFPLLVAGASLGGGGSQLNCARASFEALLRVDTSGVPAASDRRFYALLGLQGTLVDQGHAEAAVAAVDSFVARWEDGTSLYLLAAPVVPAFEERAREVARRDEVRFGPNYSRCPYPTRLWALGVWEAHAGRGEVVAAMARDMDRRASESAEPRDRVLAHSLAAYAALAQGDTVRALPLFEALVPASVPAEMLRFDEAAPLGGERLVLAKLYLARGKARQALDVASVFDSAWPWTYPLYLPASLSLRQEVAAALRDGEAEARFRARVASLNTKRIEPTQ